MNLNLSNKRDLIKLLDSLLVPHKFARAKENWYLNNQECVSVIGLGKSLYGGQFGISMAFSLKELVPELLPHPPFHLSNFRKPAEFIVPNRSELEAALNLEDGISSTDRLNIITASVTQFAVPFIERLNTKSIIAHEYKSNEDFAPYCDLDLKLALERAGYLSRAELKLDF